MITPPKNAAELIKWYRNVCAWLNKVKVGNNYFFGLGSNYSQFEEDGTLSFHGDATVFEDLQVSISNIKLPAVSAPDYEYYAFGIGSGVTFPCLAFAVNEYIYFDVQSTHSMKLGSALDHHLHFTLPNTTNIGDKFKFQLDVIAAVIDGQWSEPTGTPFTAEHTIIADDDTHHRKLDVASIPGINTTVSTVYKCKLTRISATSNEYASDVYISFNDCHFEKDSVGSRSEYVK